MPLLTLTFDQLVFLRKVVVPLEHMARATTKPLPNLQFALVTITQVQAKINRMICQGSWGIGVTFDANEVLMLKTAVWMFAATLEIAEPSSETQEAMKQCQIISALLTSLAKHK
jgi:hypothetical protein